MVELLLKHPYIFLVCFFAYPVPLLYVFYRVLWKHHTKTVREKDTEIRRLNTEWSQKTDRIQEERLREVKQATTLIHILSEDSTRNLGAIKRKLLP